MIVYFAGMETCVNSYDILPHPEDNVFCTYFYKKNTDKMLEKFSKDKGHKGIITVDSGAHSFFGYSGLSTMAHHNGKDEKNMPDPYKYWKGYLEWIVENYDKISYFVELDISEIVGYDVIMQWRQQMKDLGVFDKCIMVMHSNGMNPELSSWESFIEICNLSESGYIGLEGLRSKQINLPYGKMLKYCYQNNIKVHGFALTASEITEKYPFYSVDSTTWTASVRFGSIIVLDEKGSMKQVSCTKKNILKYGIDPNLNNKERSKEASTKKLLMSMDTQREYQKRITKLWEGRRVRWQN